MTGFRAEPALRFAIEKWIAQPNDAPKRSDAIRRLGELGLKAKGK
jgi:hypothetical protein